MKQILSIIAILMSMAACPAMAQSIVRANADAAYRSGDYQKAIELYSKELKQGNSAQTCANLANAYYRTDQLPLAILYYERALKMDPANDNIIHDLEIARNKTIDRLPPESEMFFTKWAKATYCALSIDTWAQTALYALIMALLLFLAYLFMDNMIVRRVSFYGFIVLLLLCIMGNIFAWQRKNTLSTPDSAVIMAESVNVKAAPEAKAQNTAVIHEGTKVRITDTDMKGWLGIRLSDGREGWILVKEAEQI